MDLKTLVYLSLVYLWCSIYAGRILLIVTAQTTLTADIITPEADRKEGGQVRMECTASNFDFQNYILVWQKDGITLKRNEETVTSDPRFFFSTRHEMNMVTIEQLVITGVHRNDSGIYTCNANATSTSSSSNIVSPAQVTLSVLYLPSEAFPICSPAGPITVNAGTKLNMQCSSEVGNPHVMMEISETKYNDTFSTSDLDGMTSMSLNLIAYVGYNNVRFLCTISSPMYYPGMSRSCSIGPITVNYVTEPTTTPMTESTQTSPTSPSNNTMKLATTPFQQTSSTTQSNNVTTKSPVLGTNPAIIAGAVAAGVVILITIIILILLCRRRPGHCKKEQSTNNNTSYTKPTTTASNQDKNSEPSRPNSNEDNSASLHPGTTPPRRAEVPDSSIIYAKPQKATTCIHRDFVPGVTNIGDQSYTNSVFDSKGTEGTKRPLEDPPKTSIPVAKVQPNTNVPRKPAPYRPKSDRISNAQDNPITSPSKNNDQSPEPPPGQLDDGRQETSSPPLDVTYAQVSIPNRQNSRSSQRPGDDITYAELDLTSHTSQDDGVKPSPSVVGPAIYATVTKTK